MISKILDSSEEHQIQTLEDIVLAVVGALIIPLLFTEVNFYCYSLTISNWVWLDLILINLVTVMLLSISWLKEQALTQFRFYLSGFIFKDRENSLFNPASREQVVGTGKLSGSRSCSINPRATWPLLFAIFWISAPFLSPQARSFHLLIISAFLWCWPAHGFF